MKGLLEQIRDDWTLLKTKLEIDIIEKYAYNAKLFTIITMGENSNHYERADVYIIS
jgi:hypothetical protein